MDYPDAIGYNMRLCIILGILLLSSCRELPPKNEVNIKEEQSNWITLEDGPINTYYNKSLGVYCFQTTHYNLSCIKEK